MILELDCGNSLIKWRVVNADNKVASSGVVHSDSELVQVLLESPSLSLTSCRLVSVRSEEETDELIEQLNSQLGLVCLQAKPAETLLGVANGYEDYKRLGMDRWLAVLGGFKLAGDKACLVLDLGTAITADFIDADGQHRGGFICPGIPLMRRELQTHTRRIRYDPQFEGASGHPLPGRTTAQAVEGGCVYMLRGFVRTQHELAIELLGSDVAIFLTGGDAELVKDVIPGSRIVPDLIFVGLAFACPVGSI
ncbi:type III pantothenate kinase [Pseudomonas duriflava]|uniref:Type III pantothenate kinase n=1 Tax=Pseudomonas duriflava TaxID=459528 RepID=A0A562QQ20_9PSED|nr:type III pantothenate kinase [Pseudomonas duriflava]TWI58300.1 type III pantothenate kinase [Pseudomonas duriflava]